MNTADWYYESPDDAIPDAALESWYVGSEYVGWIEHDPHAESPREWGGHALFATNHNSYAYAECPTLANILATARDYGHSDAWVRRSLDEREGILAIERFDFGHYDEATMWAYVPKLSAATLLGDPGNATDIMWWIQNALNLVEYAQEYLAAEIANFKRWDDGEVYAVVVCHLPSGHDASLYGVYDDSPHFEYCREVVDELIHECDYRVREARAS